jgi:uncharacterized membrane protein YoaK (UPF0700 family)
VTSPDIEIPRAAYGVAFPLAVVAGYVDAVGFLTLAGLFVAHMSGNTVRLGVFVGEGDWSLAAQRLVPIIVFTIGVAGGIALVEALRRRSAPAPAARVLSVEAGLLLAFMLVGWIVLDGQGAAGGSWDYYLLAVLAVLAMGWQTAALRRVAGVPVHTTFVTGILTHLAEESVNGWYAWRDRRRAGTGRRPCRRVPARPPSRWGLGQLPRRGSDRRVHRAPLGPVVAHPAARGPRGARRHRSRPKRRASLTTVGVTAGRDRRVGPGPSCPACRSLSNLRES